MQKFLMVSLLLSAGAYAMDQNDSQYNDSNTEVQLWTQIPWKEVPARQFSLQDRVACTRNIVRNLEAVKLRISQLPIQSSKKVETVNRFQGFIERGYMTFGFKCLPEKTQKEQSIAQIVNALEQDVNQQLDTDALLEQLNALTISPSLTEQFDSMTLQ